MSNKSRLQTNNTNLQELINKANALPDAGGGGGGSVETVTVTCSTWPDPGTMIYYIDGTMTLQQAEVQKGASYTILKYTIFIMTNYPSSTFDDYISLCGNSTCRGFLAH